jgi:vanillate O-demethylase ferredoxin subunit
VGERLRIIEPQNHFPLDAEPGAVLLVAGGIGVTPMVSMAQSLARRGPWLRMVYAARAPSELAYRTELQRALGERLQCVVRSQGESLDLGAEISALPEGGQMFVCGPVTLLDAARRAWRDAGRPIADLRYETFGSSGRFAPQAFRVRVPRHGLDFTVGADTSLLDALEQQGVQAMHDCRRGECGLCAVDVLALNGEIDHRDVFLSDAEKESGRRICVCVSRVVGEITLDSAWRPDR